MNLFDVYPLFNINIIKGEGCKVWDDNGQEYLDIYGGHAVISIGHCHPHYVEMMTDQLNKLGFYPTRLSTNCNSSWQSGSVRLAVMTTISYSSSTVEPRQMRMH